MSGIVCTADDSRTADRMGTGGCYRHLVYEEGSTPKEEWIKDINPIIVGKTNYYLNVYKVLKVFEGHMHRNKVDMEKRIQKFKELGIAFYTKKRLKKMDDSLSR